MSKSETVIPTDKSAIDTYSRKIIPALALSVFVLVAVIMYLALRNSQLENQLSELRSNNNAVPTVSESTKPTVSPTKQPTIIPPLSTWNTLTNSNGFTIKYPKTFKAIGTGINVNEKNASDVYITSASNDLSDPDDTSPTISIIIDEMNSPSFKGKSLAAISKANYDANLANKNLFSKIVTPYKETVLDNHAAYTYTMISSGYSGTGQGFAVGGEDYSKLTVVEAISNGKYVVIVYSADDEVIDFIIKTFKFATK